MEQQQLTRENPENAAAILDLDKKAALPAGAVDEASLVASVRVILNLDEFITRD